MMPLPWKFLVITVAALGALECSTLAYGQTTRNPFAKPDIAKPVASLVQTERRRIAKVPEPTFKLQATVVAGDNSFANLDGTILGLNEVIDGYQIVKIHRESIVVVKSGQTFTVRTGR